MQLSQQDFSFIGEFIYKEAAIVLSEGKEYLVTTRLSPIIKEFQLNGYEDLVRALKGADNRSSQIKSHVIDALTTNETSFYRDLQPFQLFKEKLIPTLMEARRSTRKISIWCAASSTGQEPYSLAMIILDNFAELLNWNVSILASDISERALKIAESGIFSQTEINRGMPATSLIKHFTKNGTNWQLKDNVRKMVSFRSLNLCKPWPPLPKMDIVFIRNVLIYFDVETKRSIFTKVKSILNPDGYMFLGAAETTLNLDASFKRMEYPRAGCYFLER